MKTTIDLPESLLERSKVAAARRRTTLKSLLIEGLEAVLQREEAQAVPAEALARLQRGYHLGNQPLSREATHGR
ncbi:MAG: hypothetical protein ACFB21_15120 [Opitutales bacterium]